MNNKINVRVIPEMTSRGPPPTLMMRAVMRTRTTVAGVKIKNIKKLITESPDKDFSSLSGFAIL
jgi:hypothetical protein